MMNTQINLPPKLPPLTWFQNVKERIWNWLRISFCDFSTPTYQVDMVAQRILKSKDNINFKEWVNNCNDNQLNLSEDANDAFKKSNLFGKRIDYSESFHKLMFLSYTHNIDPTQADLEHIISKLNDTTLYESLNQRICDHFYFSDADIAAEGDLYLHKKERRTLFRDCLVAFGKQLDPQNKVKAIAKTALGIVTTPIIPQNQNASTSDVLESDLGDRSTSFDEGRDETNSNDSETTTNTHIPPSLSDVDITTQVGSFPENIIFDVEEENPKATASESYPFLSANQEAQRQGRSPERAKAPKKRVTFTDQKSEIEPEFKMKNDKIKATVTQSSNPTKTNDLNRADVVSFDPTAYLYKRDSNKIANLVRMRVRSIPERKKVIEQWHNKYEEGLMKMSWYRHIKS